MQFDFGEVSEAISFIVNVSLHWVKKRFSAKVDIG
jgi:hypothetical protein